MLNHILFDQVEAGFIYIDHTGIIRLFNQAAKQITGIIHGSAVKHPAGKIEPGDIVLLADNLIGGDDGGLTTQHLRSIGIDDATILPGNGLVAIASYQSDKIKPVYQVRRTHLPVGELSVETTHRHTKLRAAIDYGERLLSLQVGDMTYPLSYLISMGHIVILDAKTMDLKFVQAKGYSYRDEAVAQLLAGEPFLAKGDQEISPDPVDQAARDFFGPGPFIDDIKDILDGRVERIVEKNYFLKHRQLMCSLQAVPTSEGVRGVSVNLIDISELGSLLTKRDELIETIEQNVAQLLPPRQVDGEDFQNLHGNSQAMQQVKYFISKAARIKSTVFITGENGTGKTMVAREIHRAQNPDAPFIEVNCGSIPQTLFESELFGYEAGSFTGALKKGKTGFFQLAGEGTIFLDEITEIPPSIQVKLLHVLQDKRFYPIGASQPVTISARVIAATNRDIKQEIALNRFREDLYYRLNVFPIAVPPLRQRMDDIYLLCHAIMQRLQAEYQLSDKKISSSAYHQILNYPWPGNVRELENVLERAMLICEGSTIYPEHLNLDRQRQILNLQEVKEEAEKNAIQTALLQTKDRGRLIEMLGISKSTLYDKLKQYDLEI